MGVEEQIRELFASQSQGKRRDMEALHRLILEEFPSCQLRYLDGRDDSGKTVTNPNIGYGSCQINYKDGSSREFYRVGMSANTSGISVYIMGLEDKAYLARTYSETIGKAKVTGYCIKFKSLKDIELDVLKALIQDTLST
ncbi:MAG: DUF1801 domain-containing protein [Armatimonadota bacterium]